MFTRARRNSSRKVWCSASCSAVTTTPEHLGGSSEAGVRILLRAHSIATRRTNSVPPRTTAKPRRLCHSNLVRDRSSDRGNVLSCTSVRTLTAARRAAASRPTCARSNAVRALPAFSGSLALACNISRAVDRLAKSTAAKYVRDRSVTVRICVQQTRVRHRSTTRHQTDSIPVRSIAVAPAKSTARYRTPTGPKGRYARRRELWNDAENGGCSDALGGGDSRPSSTVGMPTGRALRGRVLYSRARRGLSRGRRRELPWVTQQDREHVPRAATRQSASRLES